MFKNRHNPTTILFFPLFFFLSFTKNYGRTCSRIKRLYQKYVKKKQQHTHTHKKRVKAPALRHVDSGPLSGSIKIKGGGEGQAKPCRLEWGLERLGLPRALAPASLLYTEFDLVVWPVGFSGG